MLREVQATIGLTRKSYRNLLDIGTLQQRMGISVPSCEGQQVNIRGSKQRWEDRNVDIHLWAGAKPKLDEQLPACHFQTKPDYVGVSARGVSKETTWLVALKRVFPLTIIQNYYWAFRGQPIHKTGDSLCPHGPALSNEVLLKEK